MTTNEMRDALMSYCEKRKGCYGDEEHPDCPLQTIAFAGLGCYANVTDERIEENYNIVFGEPKEMVDHPDHYNQGSMECIDEMILIFGVEAVMDFCVCNAWKYRARAAYKGNPEEDMAKADWYLNKYKELMDNEYK